MIVKLLKPLLSDEKFETCISMSLFKNKYSEKFDKYLRRLKLSLPTISKNAFVRLYVDDSVFEDEEFKKFFDMDHPNIEYYWYQDKRFLLEDGIYHDGTFGSIIRLLALFDTSLDVDYVWVSDVDHYPRHFKYRYINEMKKSNIKVSYVSSKCYFKKWIPESVDYPIILWRLIVKKKDIHLSKYSFDKFLTDVSNYKYKELKEEIEAKEYLVKKKSLFHIDKFTYGFDELYANLYLLKPLLKYTRLIYLTVSLFVEAYKLGFKGDKILELGKKIFEKKNREAMIELIKQQKKAKLFFDKALQIQYKSDSKMKSCIDSFYNNVNKIELDEPAISTKIIVSPKE
jgi:hypothetical protein